MNDKVTKISVASRIITIVIQIIANLLIVDHKPDVFLSPRLLNETKTFDKYAEFFLGGLKKWDAEYIIHISQYGYTYENNLAFYPLYPAIIKMTTIAMQSLSDVLSYEFIAVIAATILNIYFFHRAANCLYELTQKIFGDATLAWNAVLLFSFNPASIFFSAPYTECLFSWLSFSLMLECLTEFRLIRIISTLSLSILCRSNGIINIGFPIYIYAKDIFFKRNLFKIFKLLLILIIAIIPYMCFNLFIYKQFCSDKYITHVESIKEYAKLNNYVLAGPRIYPNSPWCDYILPFPYKFLQQHYWDVGLFKYYKLKQIPNFILAAPILIFIYIKSLVYLLKMKKIIYEKGISETMKIYKSLPFVIHILFLGIFSTLFIHIQVSTRLLASASPCLYWFAAEYLPKSFEGLKLSIPKLNSIKSLIIYWFGIYFILGIILFSNFYPWT